MISPCGEIESRLENPNWFTTDFMSFTTCEHCVGKADVKKGNIDESMDISNNAKKNKVKAPGQSPLIPIRHPRANRMLTFLQTVGPNYAHKLYQLELLLRLCVKESAAP